MLCARFENEHECSRRVKTEFLVQIDGCTSSASGMLEDRVLVLAATNRPQDLDEGALRRFTKRIMIDLPDEEARAEMIKGTFEKHSTRVELSKEELEYVLCLFSDLFNQITDFSNLFLREFVFYTEI